MCIETKSASSFRTEKGTEITARDGYTLYESEHIKGTLECVACLLRVHFEYISLVVKEVLFI